MKYQSPRYSTFRHDNTHKMKSAEVLKNNLVDDYLYVVVDCHRKRVELDDLSKTLVTPSALLLASTTDPKIVLAVLSFDPVDISIPLS